MLLTSGDLTLNRESREVKKAGKRIDLTEKEYELLVYLMRHKGSVVSRQDLLKNVWQYSPGIVSRVADVYIGYLRRKLNLKGKKKMIVSVRGFGYSIKK